MNRKNFLKMIIAVACMAFATPPAYADGEGVQVDLQVSIDAPSTQYECTFLPKCDKRL